MESKWEWRTCVIFSFFSLGDGGGGIGGHFRNSGIKNWTWTFPPLGCVWIEILTGPSVACRHGSKSLTTFLISVFALKCVESKEWEVANWSVIVICSICRSLTWRHCSQKKSSGIGLFLGKTLWTALLWRWDVWSVYAGILLLLLKYSFEVQQ